MIDTQSIRKKILDLALQGKLTEQLPEDGTAEDLYAKIQAENTFIVDPDPKISGEEKEYDIPSSWMYVRLNTVATLHNGRAYSQSELLSEGKYPVLRVGNLFTNNSWYYSDLELEPEKYCDNGDLLYAWSASFGPYIWDGNKVIYHYHIWKVEHSSFIDRDYLYYYLLADTNNIKKAAHGMAMVHVTKANTEKRVIVLPPLSEQKRITRKINYIYSILDVIDTLQSQYQDNLATLKSKIIDAGIQGKLTEQLPEDGTAEELYQQIQQEKLVLEKAGKIKKSKPLPPVTADEVPFDVPENWKWVQFSDLMQTISTGPFGSMLHKSDYVSNGIPLVNPMNIVNGNIIPSEKMMVSAETKERLSTYILHKGMIVMGRRGEMGRCAIVSENEDGWICGTGSFFMQPVSMIHIPYIVLFLSTAYAREYLGGQSIGMTMSNLNHGILLKIPVPLPPLAEQKRIVAKLEELLPLCEK